MTFCFDIGGSKIIGARVSDQGVIHDPEKRATPVRSRHEFIAMLASMIPADTSAVAIAIAGTIDPADGRLTSANIPCVSGCDLQTELRRELDCDVTVINDADAFALAEVHHGRARGHGVVLAVILGTGVGGSVVLDGQLHRGRAGVSGEWGHGPAQAMRSGQLLPRLGCDCGQWGCVDTLGGARGLERLYHHVHREMQDSHSIVKLWQAGNDRACRVIDLWLDVVGGALAAAVNLLGPSVVPVGGGLANSEVLVQALDREVCRRSLLGDESGLLYAVHPGPQRALLGAARQASLNRDRECADS